MNTEFHLESLIMTETGASVVLFRSELRVSLVAEGKFLGSST